MTSQLHAVQREIQQVRAQTHKADGELAIASAGTDTKEVDFLRDSLVSLRSQLASLRQQETIFLRAQVPGQHCLPPQTSLELHTTVC